MYTIGRQCQLDFRGFEIEPSRLNWLHEWSLSFVICISHITIGKVTEFAASPTTPQILLSMSYKRQTAVEPSAVSSLARRAPEILVALLVIALAGLVRWLASRGDFWLDEIWTWLLVQQQVRTDFDVITRILHDNNHILNSWVMFRMGPEQSLGLYRLPAVIAGTAAVALAGWQARSRSTAEVVVAMLLTGWSFILVHYSSEARGYAYMLFFGMLTYCAQARFDRSLSWLSGIGFSLACVGGFLAQFAFVFMYVGIGVWQAWSLWRDPSRRRFWMLLLVHLPPLTLLSVLYALNPFKVGGADVIPTVYVIRMALSLAVGGPEYGTGSWVAAAGSLVVLIAGIIWLWRADRSEGVFFFTGIILAPVLVMLITGYGHLLPRHLLIPILLWQLLAARCLSQLWNRAWMGRGLMVLLLVISLAINFWPIERLLKDGRGNYVAALQFMSAETKLPVVTVGSNHDDRNRKIILFYTGQFFMPGDHPRAKLPIYIDQNKLAELRPEWFLLHSQEHNFDPPPSLKLGDNEYQLRKKFPYSTLSGWHWAVYQTDKPSPIPDSWKRMIQQQPL